MNFDKLKSDWNQEPEKELNIPENLERLGKSKLPIEIIQKNMRYEFWSTIIGTFISAFLPQIFNIRSSFYTTYYILYAFYCTLAVYYFYEFYKFYKILNNYSGNSKDNLYEIYYEIRLKIETYRTYGYSLTPYVIASIALIFLDFKSEKDASISDLLSKNYLSTLLFFLGGVLGYYIISLKYINSTYSIHLQRIKSLLFDLTDNGEYETKISKISENYGFIHALITGKGDKKKSFFVLVILTTLLLIGYYVGGWLALNGF
jgi:hypothetical protein